MVVIGEGAEHQTWLLVSGVVKRHITSDEFRMWLVEAMSQQLRSSRPVNWVAQRQKNRATITTIGIRPAEPGSRSRPFIRGADDVR